MTGTASGVRAGVVSGVYKVGCAVTWPRTPYDGVVRHRHRWLSRQTWGLWSLRHQRGGRVGRNGSRRTTWADAGPCIHDPNPRRLF